MNVLEEFRQILFVFHSSSVSHQIGVDVYIFTFKSTFSWLFVNLSDVTVNVKYFQHLKLENTLASSIFYVKHNHLILNQNVMLALILINPELRRLSGIFFFALKLKYDLLTFHSLIQYVIFFKINLEIRKNQL